MNSFRRPALIVAVAVLVAVVVVVRWWNPDTRRADAPLSTAARRTVVPPMRSAVALPRGLSTKVELALRDPLAALRDFNSWREQYDAVPDAAARVALVPHGVVLARERREWMRELIAIDPELALRLSLSRTERGRLPFAVAAELEELVSGRGDFHAIATLPGADAPADFRAVRRQAVIGGLSYEAFVFGRRARLATSSDIGLHGVAIDGRLALSDSPVRLLEAGESPAVDRTIVELCAVSGRPAGPEVAAAGSTAVIGADAGDRIYYLCSAGHIAQLEDQLYAHDNGSTGNAGPEVAPMAAAELGHTTGEKRVLLIRVRFAGDATLSEPQSVGSAENTFVAANAFFRENSFGALSIQPVITPVYTLPQTAEWYRANDTSGYALNILEAARNIAADPASAPGNQGLAAYTYTDFDFEAVRYTGGPGAFTGQAYVGVRGCWLKSSSVGVLVHELGHNLGLWHANFWEPASTDALTGAGSNREYGDVHSTMGSSVAGALHFNAAEKARLGWLPPESVATAVTSGMHRIFAHDRGGAVDGGKLFALRIPRPDGREYWFEFRQHTGWNSNPWLINGLGARWDVWDQSNGGTQLLDTTPGSAVGKEDAAIVIGHTYTDAVAGIHVTPLRKNGTSPESLEVDVQVGSFPENRPPSVRLSASASIAAVGTPVTFTAAASDADYDELAYAWDFGDGGIGANASSTQHRWTTPGDRHVRVTVSDRKGGTASMSAIVRVGAVSGVRVSGVVRDLNGQPIADARVYTSDLGVEDINYREALTDADGRFTLVGVTEDTWSLAASKPGWTIAPATFANPVGIQGDLGGIDFRGHRVGWLVTGVVRFSDGTPVAGAVVGDGTRSEPTAADGTFALTGVPVGTYAIHVSAPGAQFSPVQVQVAFADTVVPAIVEVTGASAPGFRPDNQPPSFTQPATVSGTLPGSFVRLAARATDDRNAALLRYHWSIVGPVPAQVEFTANDAQAAADTVARFFAAGVYRLRVTVTDSEGASATSEIDLTIGSVSDEVGDSTLASWQRAHFNAQELEDPAQEATRWGVDADPDGDGTINLLEYAFDLDPLTPETEGLPRPTFVTVDGVEYLAITFRRNRAASDVVFTPQASSDLQTWSAAMVAVGDPEAAQVTYRDTIPAANFDKRFVRVEVTAP